MQLHAIAANEVAVMYLISFKGKHYYYAIGCDQEYLEMSTEAMDLLKKGLLRSFITHRLGSDQEGMLIMYKYQCTRETVNNKSKQ